MEHIILSLLLLKTMTIYEMRAYIQQNLSTVCSDSLGSLQTALKKLLEKKYIEVCEYTENNMLKKQYSITYAGVIHYKEWIGSPMNTQKMKNMEEGKFFFLGMASKNKRIKFIESYLDSLKIEYEKLIFIQSAVNDAKDSVIEVNVNRIIEDKNLTNNLLDIAEEDNLEKVIHNIYRYQIYMLEYGIQKLTDDIKFYKMILKREQME